MQTASVAPGPILNGCTESPRFRSAAMSPTATDVCHHTTRRSRTPSIQSQVLCDQFNCPTVMELAAFRTRTQVSYPATDSSQEMERYRQGPCCKRGCSMCCLPSGILKIATSDGQTEPPIEDPDMHGACGCGPNPGHPGTESPPRLIG